MWVAEVDLNIRGQGELLVGMHLGAPVPGQRLVELLWQFAGMLDERVDDRLRVFAIELHQHHVARLTLDQGCNLAVAATKDQITFPMSRHSSVFNARRTFTVRDCIGDLAMDCGLLRVVPGAAHSASTSEVFQQFLLQGATRLNE